MKYSAVALKYAFLLFPLLIPLGGKAWTPIAESSTIPEPAPDGSGSSPQCNHPISERDAVFMGIDSEEFVYWVGSNTVYPEAAYEAARWGDVTVEFFVEPDGTLSSLKVMDSSDDSFTEAVTETIAKSPLWEPAIRQGEPIRSRVEITVPFVFPGDINRIAPNAETEELVKPKFGGGHLEAFRKWIHQQVLYPESAVRNGIEGTVIVSFIVSYKGIVQNIRIISSPHYSLSAEVVRVLKSSPLWEPGRINGEPVSYMYSMPVIFTFRN